MPMALEVPDRTQRVWPEEKPTGDANMADQTNKPTHDVCFVEDRKGKKGFWTRIGAAWAHKDNGGLSLELDFLPLNVAAGRIVVRVRTEKPSEEAAQ
jgi:hypothetical protein